MYFVWMPGKGLKSSVRFHVSIVSVIIRADMMWDWSLWSMCCCYRFPSLGTELFPEKLLEQGLLYWCPDKAALFPSGRSCEP